MKYLTQVSASENRNQRHCVCETVLTPGIQSVLVSGSAGVVFTGLIVHYGALLNQLRR